jgi:hypothetical protein
MATVPESLWLIHGSPVNFSGFPVNLGVPCGFQLFLNQPEGTQGLMGKINWENLSSL